MTEEPAESRAPDTRRLACHVLCAYLRHNTMPTSEVPTAVRAIHRAFEAIAAPAPSVHLAPAVPVKKSITRNYLICLEDGRKLKTLKRYLRTKYGMTPEEYPPSGACHRATR